MEWRTRFNQNVLNGAEDYIQSSPVQDLRIEENHVTARVIDIEDYDVDIRLSKDTVSSMKCNCPCAIAGGNCKHMAAVMLVWENCTRAEPDAEPGEPVTPTEPVTLSEPVIPAESVAGEPALAEEEEPAVSPAKNCLQLTSNIDDVLNFAIIHNGAHIVRDICVKNVSEIDLEHLMIRISTGNGLTEDYKLGIEKIKPGEELHFRNLDVQVNADYLVSLTERCTCQLTVGIYSGESLLVSESTNLTALAFDQWPGLQYTPELLAAFAMPNHPVVTSMLQLAARYLEKWTGDPSLAGYQFDDPNRVKHMAAAAYAAVQQKNITYAEPPSSFETFGQRIRLADAVLEQHLGTCMDMTPQDVAVLISMSGNTKEVLEMLALSRQCGTPTVALTKFDKSVLAQNADIRLYISAPEATPRSGAMSSRIAQMVAVDVLFTAVAHLDYDRAAASLEKSRESCRPHRVDGAPPLRRRY